jgi:hypothetical protein
MDLLWTFLGAAVGLFGLVWWWDDRRSVRRLREMETANLDAEYRALVAGELGEGVPGVRVEATVPPAPRHRKGARRWTR